MAIVAKCYRQTAERSVNWLEMNMWLSAFAFKEGKGRNAIVIDPSFIKKAGKHTPYVGTFWSGCAGAVDPRYRGDRCRPA